MKRAIQKTLAIRLGLVAVVISAVLGAVVFTNERRRVGEGVIERALQAATRFNVLIADLLGADRLGAEEIQGEMELFSKGAIASRSGKFVVARVYDRAGAELGRLSDAEHRLIDEVERRMDPAVHELPASEDERVDVVWIDDQPHVWIAIPLANTAGQDVAHIEGVFAVSAAALADIDRRVLRAVLWVIGIVVLTSLAAYPTIVTLLNRVTNLTANLLDSNLETLQVLGSAVAKRDSDTDIHNYRVTVYATRLAEAVGLDGNAIRGLIKGAFLHDVGKIGVRDNILLKPGKLTDDEYAIMKTHVDHGLDIVKRSAWLEDATDVVGGHHEKFDGTGYSVGLRGQGIPYAARIFAIADVFDALTSKRPYKEAMSFDETMSILEQGRGSHFDPDVLDTFRCIARPLYDQFAGHDDETPKRELENIIDRYFTKDFIK
jgi:HD-GYP domain-containing protein (c-di-GMP phosphodiesterase class II)